jgi:hypothetical protein
MDETQRALFEEFLLTLVPKPFERDGPTLAALADFVLLPDADRLGAFKAWIAEEQAEAARLIPVVEGNRIQEVLDLNARAAALEAAQKEAMPVAEGV